MLLALHGKLERYALSIKSVHTLYPSVIAYAVLGIICLFFIANHCDCRGKYITPHLLKHFNYVVE